MATRDSTLKIHLGPAAFQAGLRRTVEHVKAAGIAMGRGLKEPLNAGLKSANSEVGNLLSTLKDGLRTVGTLGGALAIGSFIRDSIALQQLYGNIAFQVNKVGKQTMTWQSVQQMVQEEIVLTGRKAEELSEIFSTVFSETADVDAARKAMHAVGVAVTATGHAANVLGDNTQIAMTKWNVKTPEEALERIISGTGRGGLQIDQMRGSFEMLGEAAAAAGHTGGPAMSMFMNMITEYGDKALPGLEMMMQTMKEGSSQVIKLQKAMGTKVKFTADMSALDRVRATLTHDKGRDAAEKIFRGNARIVYDKLAESYDVAFKAALEKAGKAKDARSQAISAGLKAFDENIKRLQQSEQKWNDVEAQAEKRRKDDPAQKLDETIERVRQKFADPRMLGAIDSLSDRLPAFADAVSKIIDYVLDNPWESLAVLVGGKLALAFGGTVITEAIKAGMTGLFARMAAVQAASAAVPLGPALAGAAAPSAVGLGGAVTGGAVGAGSTAVAASAATVAAAVTGAALVGAGAGYAGYKAFIEEDQEGEWDARHKAQETLMTTGRLGTLDRSGNIRGSEAEIQKALMELNAAKSGLDKDSTWNDIAGAVVRPFIQGGAGVGADPIKHTTKEIEDEEKRLAAALRKLRENIGTLNGGAGTSRGPMRPANTNPGAKPVTG